MADEITHDFDSINFPPLIHISRKFFWRNRDVILGWRHRLRQKIRSEFTMKEILELLKRDVMFPRIYRQAIFLDKTLFEIHEFWKQKYNSQKLTFAITGWRRNLPADIVQTILEYLPSTGSPPSGPWKK